MRTFSRFVKLSLPSSTPHLLKRSGISRALLFLRCFRMVPNVGAFSVKEDTPMKCFLRDMLATVVSTILAAVVVRLLNL